MVKMMKRLSLGLMVLAAAVMAAPVMGSAYSYGAWVGMTGAKTVAVNPFYAISFSNPYAGTPTIKFDYGFSDKFDVMFDISDGWIMPRVDLLGNNLLIAAVQLGTAGPGLQLHGFYDKAKMFALEYNLYTTTGGWNFSSFNMGAIIAPTLKLGDFGIWVEADLNNIITGFGFDMGAGVYINVDKSQISIGVNSILGSPNLGAWLWTPFGLN
jgi:hypothetical protein